MSARFLSDGLTGHFSARCFKTNTNEPRTALSQREGTVTCLGEINRAAKKVAWIASLLVSLARHLHGLGKFGQASCDSF